LLTGAYRLSKAKAARLLTDLFSIVDSVRVIDEGALGLGVSALTAGFVG
jgi:hypothetical protein